MSTPRLPPLPRERWDDDARVALRTGLGEEAASQLLSDSPDAPPIPNVLATLMHHPKLAGRWLAYNRGLLYRPVLTHRLRELIVLRVAWRTRSPYEWLQHLHQAPRHDITADDVDAIARGVTSDTWSPLEVDVLAATDQLIDHYCVDDETWTRLSAQLDERQLVEVVFVAGSYTCLAMAFNSFGLEPDAELRPPPTVPMPDRDSPRKEQ